MANRALAPDDGGKRRDRRCQRLAAGRVRRRDRGRGGAPVPERSGVSGPDEHRHG